MVRSEFHKVRLVANLEYVGFARANNHGFRLCHGRYGLLLNSDSEPLPGVINALLTCMDGHPGVGLTGPALFDPEKTIIVPSGGQLPTLWSLLVHNIFVFDKVERAHFADKRSSKMRRTWITVRGRPGRKKLLSVAGEGHRSGRLRRPMGPSQLLNHGLAWKIACVTRASLTAD